MGNCTSKPSLIDERWSERAVCQEGPDEHESERIRSDRRCDPTGQVGVDMGGPKAGVEGGVPDVGATWGMVSMGSSERSERGAIK